MKKMSVPVAILIALTIAACSKDSNKSTAPPTTEPPTDSTTNPTSSDLVAAHIWNIDTIAFDANRDGTIDMSVPGGLKPCDMDNTLKFNSDSTGTFDEGSLKCVDGNAQSVPFTWYLKNGDSTVNITGAIPGELHGDINILKLSDSTLIMSKPVAYNSDTVSLIIALKK